MRYAKRLFHLLKRKWQRKKSLPYSISPPVELFDSIKTLIINNWDEIKDTGNIFLLSETKTQDRSNKFFRYCADTWDSIRDQEIKKFDILNKPYFSKVSEVALLNIQHAFSQDNWDLMLLTIGKRELEEFDQGEKSDTTEVKFILQKSDININLRTDTVDDYYTAINLQKKTVSYGR